MPKDEMRMFIEHWDKILKQQESIQPKKKKESANFFTDTKGPKKRGPDAALVEGWHRIMNGAEDLESDHRSEIRSDELAADEVPEDEGDGWLAKSLEDYGSPPTGRAGEKKPELVFQENNERADEDHWRKLAKNLKIKEGRSVKGSGYLNTSDAAARLGMTMEHFLRCVWKINEFAKPQPFGNVMAYRISDIDEIKENLVQEGFNFPASKEFKKLNQEGFGKLVRGDKQMTKGDITYENLPTTWSSVGPDQNPYPKGPTDSPVRVSKFSTSPEIDEVAEMKRRLEIMERRVHKADVEGNKKKRDGLIKELTAMRKKISEISDDMQSHPDTDVT
jgi:hypothetical protein